MDKDEAVAFPEDLNGLSNEELNALESQTLSEFDSLVALGDEITDDGITELEGLATRIEALSTHRQSRVAAATQRTGKVAAAAERAAQAKALGDVAKAAAAAAVANTTPEEPEPVEDPEPAAPEPEAVPVVAGGARTTPRVSPSLAAAQNAAPPVPERGRPDLQIVAASPTSGVHIGQNFSDMDQLVAAVQSYSRGMAVTHGQPSFATIATIANEYEEVIDGDRATVQEFEAMARRLRTPERTEALVAGGGWCAPSETKYNFFNIACSDGVVDLPTFGVKRGGIRFPISPSLASVFTGAFTNATNPWLWTEADDILTVTGSVNKPCVRVPCATMDERRLECYGICLTAGNLTDNAWPEATKNYLSLLMSAHTRAMNTRYLGQMVALSSSAITFVTGVGGSGEAISADLPDAVAIAAVDYRTYYGMCQDDVLEVILPYWVREAIRSDLGRRTGVDLTQVSDAEINALFTVRNVRIQWVADWQVRATGQPGQAAATALTYWPDTVQFMIYAAGTFMLGNGMNLDLGVVRDSVLNAENDHTAAWMEECHLIAKIGHESRLYTVPVCVAGRTGSANITNCHTI